MARKLSKAQVRAILGAEVCSHPRASALLSDRGVMDDLRRRSVGFLSRPDLGWSLCHLDPQVGLAYFLQNERTQATLRRGRAGDPDEEKVTGPLVASGHSWASSGHADLPTMAYGMMVASGVDTGMRSLVDAFSALWDERSREASPGDCEDRPG